MMPGNIGIIVEYETDNKLGHMPLLKSAIMKSGGTPSPSTFLFTRKGRVVLDRGERSFEDVFEQALEASALDVVDESEGRVTVIAEPTQTTAVADALVESLELKPEDVESDVVWHANADTESELQGSAAAMQLVRLMDVLDELDVGVQKVFLNATKGTVDDEAWSELQSRLG
jgi:transcriptional/translational regulatory protein YebC/TACO1